MQRIIFAPLASGERASWEQIAGALRSAIEQGRLKPGAELPSARALAQDAGVTKRTVTCAYDALADEGLVHRLLRGYTVAAPARVPASRDARLASLASEVARVRAGFLAAGYTLEEINAALREQCAEFAPAAVRAEALQ
ncbi:MAG: GntR family transcriptional regulator [bacterium]|nr:GntR family transcriptional regulator [bacterium]